jgi:hypothetical protein
VYVYVLVEGGRVEYKKREKGREIEEGMSRGPLERVERLLGNRWAGFLFGAELVAWTSFRIPCSLSSSTPRPGSHARALQLTLPKMPLRYPATGHVR